MSLLRTSSFKICFLLSIASSMSSHMESVNSFLPSGPRSQSASRRLLTSSSRLWARSKVSTLPRSVSRSLLLSSSQPRLPVFPSLPRLRLRFVFSLFCSYFGNFWLVFQRKKTIKSTEFIDDSDAGASQVNGTVPGFCKRGHDDSSNDSVSPHFFFFIIPSCP